jgi:uncharacterized membrane protein
MRTLERDRLEAFSDGVLAVIITIMVLELKVPHAGTLAALKPMIPTLLAYALSFTFVGIYWNNHHHLLRAAGGIDGTVMWANLHLLFWLSFIPFVTSWVGTHLTDPIPMSVYGFDLLMSAVAFSLLASSLVRANGPDSLLARQSGLDAKQIASVVAYVAAIAGAFVATWISAVVYFAVALMWLVPDRRLESAIVESQKGR